MTKNISYLDSRLELKVLMGYLKDSKSVLKLISEQKQNQTSIRHELEK